MAFSAVWGNKVRSFLTMLGVIIGVLGRLPAYYAGSGGQGGDRQADQLSGLRSGGGAGERPDFGAPFYSLTSVTNMTEMEK